jgi:hypothetical protein
VVADACHSTHRGGIKKRSHPGQLRQKTRDLIQRISKKAKNDWECG